MAREAARPAIMLAFWLSAVTCRKLEKLFGSGVLRPPRSLSHWWKSSLVTELRSREAVMHYLHQYDIDILLLSALCNIGS
jgi:hypothetical protein